MGLEELKDQLRDKFQELKAQIEDSPTFNNFKERFETLNPSAQKTIIWSAVVLTSLFLFSCPYSYWSTSRQYVQEYEDTRDMIRDLLRASNLANQLGNLPPQIDGAQLELEVQRALADAKLLPDQVVGVTAGDAKTFGTPLAPASIEQSGLVVRLRQLNVRQIVEVGHRLQNLNASVKLAGMDLKVFPQDPRYYNADFRLIKFSLPMANAEPEAPAQPSGRRGQKNE